MFKIKEENRTFFRYITLSVYMFIVLALTFYGLFGAKGQESQLYLGRAYLYIATLITSFVVLGLLRWGQSRVEKNPKLQDRWGWVYAPFHEPEKSLVSKNPVTRWMVSRFSVMFVIFFVLWNVIGAFGAISGTFFAPIAQQVTEVGKFIFEIYPASPSETLFECVIIFLLLGLFRWLMIYKLKQKEWAFWILSLIFIPILIGFERVIIHIARYEVVEKALVVSFGYGVIGALLTILFLSIVPFMMWHDINNAYYSLDILLASDIAVVSILGLVSLIVIFLIILLWIRRRNKRKNEENV